MSILKSVLNLLRNSMVFMGIQNLLNENQGAGRSSCRHPAVGDTSPWLCSPPALLATGCAGTAALPAAEIHVPDFQPAIQAGLDAAVAGDILIVADGV